MPPDLKENNPVKHPNHYQSRHPRYDIECINAIKAMLGPEGFIAYCRGTIAAYNWRLGSKDTPIQELGKIQIYINHLEESLIAAQETVPTQPPWTP